MFAIPLLRARYPKIRKEEIEWRGQVGNELMGFVDGQRSSMSRADGTRLTSTLITKNARLRLRASPPLYLTVCNV
jgi:hypothetical protein